MFYTKIDLYEIELVACTLVNGVTSVPPIIYDFCTEHIANPLVVSILGQQFNMMSPPTGALANPWLGIEPQPYA